MNVRCVCVCVCVCVCACVCVCVCVCVWVSMVKLCFLDCFSEDVNILIHILRNRKPSPLAGVMPQGATTSMLYITH